MLDVIVSAKFDENSGFGHVARAHALASWAVRLGYSVSAVVSSPTPGWLIWPCPVWDEESYDGEPILGRVLIADHYMPERTAGRTIAIVDTVDAIVNLSRASEASLEFVYPHFGAKPVGGAPGWYGPAYMPLRPDFAKPPEPDPSTPFVLGYSWHRKHARRLLTAEKLARYKGVIAPPSTIAYEALAVGIKLWLSDELPEYAHIARAMIESGVAVDAKEYPEYGLERRRHIDGLGAERLLEAVLT